MDRTDKVMEIIEGAFRDLVYPGDENLFEVYDPGIPGFVEILHKHGTDWRLFYAFLESSPMPISQLYGGMVYFLTPVAYHYFAPAYLAFVLHENADVLPGAFFDRVTPCASDTQDSGRWKTQTFEMFSERQQRLFAAIAILYYASHEAPSKRIVGDAIYWAQWITDHCVVTRVRNS